MFAKTMTIGRVGITIAHILALPVAVLLAVVLAALSPLESSRAAVDIELHDTFFVVAHFHATILLGTCVGVGTFVASRYGQVNWAVIGSWLLCLIHFIAAVIPWLPSGALGDAEPNTLVRVRPAQPGLAHVYLVSALGGLLTILLGLGISLWRALRTPELPTG